jgi:hypothetical protein
MSSYMLLLHETADFNDVSPAEIQILADIWLGGKGYRRRRSVHSNKLQDEGGKVISRSNGKLVVVDGPYAQAREVISGYFVIKATSYDEAVHIAMTCPHAEGNGRIEVREIHEMG